MSLKNYEIGDFCYGYGFQRGLLNMSLKNYEIGDFCYGHGFQRGLLNMSLKNNEISPNNRIVSKCLFNVI
ncbi:MAG: hypothetical protein FWG98_05750 [Candidatus Cloacimonetes bacterium]|nr:hypothetical protein [Candidatus Cloacimonadota bacterium]